jgi:hypothetical protein
MRRPGGRAELGRSSRRGDRASHRQELLDLVQVEVEVRDDAEALRRAQLGEPLGAGAARAQRVGRLAARGERHLQHELGCGRGSGWGPGPGPRTGPRLQSKLGSGPGRGRGSPVEQSGTCSTAIPAKSAREMPGNCARAATIAERSAQKEPPAGSETSAFMPQTKCGSPSTVTISTASTSFSDCRWNHGSGGAAETRSMKLRISRVSSAVTSVSSKTDGLGRRRVYVVCPTHSGSPGGASASASSASTLAASTRAASALASLRRAFASLALAALASAFEALARRWSAAPRSSTALEHSGQEHCCPRCDTAAHGAPLAPERSKRARGVRRSMTASAEQARSSAARRSIVG